MRLAEGQTALVTGASRGLGVEIARHLAEWPAYAIWNAAQLAYQQLEWFPTYAQMLKLVYQAKEPPDPDGQKHESGEDGVARREGADATRILARRRNRDGQKD